MGKTARGSIISSVLLFSLVTLGGIGCGGSEEAVPTSGAGASQGGGGGSKAGSGGAPGGSGGTAGGSAGAPGGSGGTAGGNGGSAGQGPPAKDSWTVFIYGHADHSLSPSLVADLKEMSDATLNDNFKVVMLADWNGSSFKDPMTMTEKYPTGAQWLQVQGNKQKEKVLKEEPEKNLDDPAVLSDAIKTAFSMFPAEHHGLIMWDHGGLWTGGFGGDEQDGTVKMQPVTMRSAVLQTAIRQGLDGAGLGGSRPLEFLAFDTCLLGALEIIYPLRDLSKVFIGNAEIDYGRGWDYTSSFTFLAGNPTVSALDFAKKEVEFWDAHHLGKDSNPIPATPDDKLFRAHVAVDTTKVDAIASSHKALADALIADPTGLAAIPKKTFYALPSYTEQSSTNSLTKASVRDTKHLLDSLLDSPVGSLAQAANDALSSAILASSLGEQRINHQNGIHVWMPSFGNPLAEAALYDEESWAKDTNWGSLIKAINAANPKKDPDFTVTLVNGDNPTAQTPPTLDVAINDEDSIYGELRIAEKLSDTKYKLYGTGAIQPLTGGAQLSVSWSGALGALENNGVLVPIAASPWKLVTPDQNGEFPNSTVAIAGSIAVQDKQTGKEETAFVLAFLLLDDSTNEITTVVFFDGPAPAARPYSEFMKLFGEFSPAFKPYYQIAEKTGDTLALQDTPESGPPIPLAETPPKVTFVQAEAGTYNLSFSVTNSWGKTIKKGHDVTLAAPL